MTDQEITKGFLLSYSANALKAINQLAGLVERFPVQEQTLRNQRVTWKAQELQTELAQLIDDLKREREIEDLSGIKIGLTS